MIRNGSDLSSVALTQVQMGCPCPLSLIIFVVCYLNLVIISRNKTKSLLNPLWYPAKLGVVRFDGGFPVMLDDSTHLLLIEYEFREFFFFSLAQ